MNAPGPNSSAERQAVIAVVWLGERRELATRVPIHVTAIDEHTAECHTMAADELGDRVHDDVGAVLDRSDQCRGGERGIDHERQAVAMGNVGDGFDVHHLDTRIAERLAVDESGVVGDRRLEGVRDHADRQMWW